MKLNAKTIKQSRESLQDLPIDIAIRLRWVLRDIRAAKLLGPSRDDLRLLAQCGLISVDNDKLVLTEAGCN